MRTLTGLLLAVVVAGCSSNKADDSTYTAATPTVSGTRLRARVVAGGGGREVIGFHDVERNEDCTFQGAEDGRTRCLPVTLFASSNGRFSDPQCQVPVATVPQSCKEADAKYAIVSRSNDVCGGVVPTEIRRVLDPAGAIYTNGPTGCVTAPPSSNGTPPNGTPLGEVVPWTDFVEATETIVAADGIAERVLVATDGARQHVGFRLTTIEADCDFEVMADGVARCVPAGSRAGSVFYADSACTQASFILDYEYSQPCAKNADSALWIEPTGSCGSARAIFALGETVASSVQDVYSYSNTGSPRASSTTCNSSRTSSNPQTNHRKIATDLTPSLPKTPAVGSGGGRLAPAFVSVPSTNPSNNAKLTPGWHDNERGVDCTFELASDGKMRCLPAAATATLFFTDNECKSPSRVAVLSTAACNADTRFARVVSSTCPATTRVFALGATPRNLTSGSTETSPGRCPTVAGVNNAFDATEVDPTGFVEGVLTTE